MSPQLIELRKILTPVLSPMTVDMFVLRAVEAAGLDLRQVNEEHLPAIVEQVMKALRLFMAEDQLPDVMVELAMLVDRAESVRPPSTS